MGCLASGLLMTIQSNASAFTVKISICFKFSNKSFTITDHYMTSASLSIDQEVDTSKRRGFMMSRVVQQQGKVQPKTSPGESPETQTVPHYTLLLQIHECAFDLLIKHTFYMRSETSPNTLLGYLHLNRPFAAVFVATISGYLQQDIKTFSS